METHYTHLLIIIYPHFLSFFNGVKTDLNASQASLKKAELGTRQFRRDNVTMLSGHKVVCNFYFTIFIVATPSRH